MSGKLTRYAYEQLIAEDIAWIKTIPRTLERDHIIMVLEASPGHEYGERAPESEPPPPEVCSCWRYEQDQTSRCPLHGEATGTCGECRGTGCPDCNGTGRSPRPETGSPFAELLSKRKYGPRSRHCYCGHLWDSHDATGCVYDRDECDCNAPKPKPEEPEGRAGMPETLPRVLAKGARSIHGWDLGGWGLVPQCYEGPDESCIIPDSVDWDSYRTLTGGTRGEGG